MTGEGVGRCADTARQGARATGGRLRDRGGSAKGRSWVRAEESGLWNEGVGRVSRRILFVASG